MVIGAHDSMITMENGGNAIYGATCGVMTHYYAYCVVIMHVMYGDY